MPENILDVFTGDAFSAVTMTNALDVSDFVPSYFNGLGLFKFEGVPTETVTLEIRENVLHLLQTGTKNAKKNRLVQPSRYKKAFPIPHIPVESEIFASSLQSVVEFGSPAKTLENFRKKTAEELAVHRQAHENTFELHYAGAVAGVLLDADGSTIYNYQTEFGVTPVSHTFDFGAGTAGELQVSCDAVVTSIRSKLGGLTGSGIAALCDQDFWDAMLASEGMRVAWERWQDGAHLRREQEVNMDMFTYGGITWVKYYGTIGGASYLQGTNICRFYPVGVPGLFRHYGGPGTGINEVNKPGKRISAKQSLKKYDEGIDIFSQSNPLIICVRPDVLQSGTSV